MDELVSGEDRDLDEGLDGLDVEADSSPTDQPELYTGEVPPEEEIAGSDSPPAAGAAVKPGEPTAQGGVGASPEPISQAPGVPEAIQRTVKVVVTLRPAVKPGDPGSALVAVGAEGHEPALRYLDSCGLAEALAVVPEVLAAALATWERRKSAPVSSRPASAERPPATAVEVADGTAPSRSAPQPAASSRRPRTSEPTATQPSLFG